MKSFSCFFVAFFLCLISISIDFASADCIKGGLFGGPSLDMDRTSSADCKLKNISTALVFRIDRIASSLGDGEVREKGVDYGVPEEIYRFVKSSKEYVIKGILRSGDREAAITVYEFVRMASFKDKSPKQLEEGEVYDVHCGMVLKKVSSEKISCGNGGIIVVEKGE